MQLQWREAVGLASGDYSAVLSNVRVAVGVVAALNGFEGRFELAKGSLVVGDIRKDTHSEVHLPFVRLEGMVVLVAECWFVRLAW